MLFENLFTIENVNDIPDDKTFDDYLNPDSVTRICGCKIEPLLALSKGPERFQFVRNGYFIRDSKYANTFNRIVTLKDNFKNK